MKAYRVYHIDTRWHDNPTKIYKCNRPGYWAHHSEDTEYAMPFLSKEIAEEYATFNEKHVSPPGKRYVEEYEETRRLVINQFDGDVTFAKFMPYYTERNCYNPA